MPILGAPYIGTLQRIRLTEGTLAGIYLLDNLTQVQESTVKDRAMLQGTIGTRIMDVGEIVWKTDIDSLAIIFQGTNDYTGDVFTLVQNKWNEIVNFSSTYNLTLPILEKATININKDDVKINATFLGNKPYFQPELSTPTNDFIARVVKWYDCMLVFDKPGGLEGFNGVVSSSATDYAIEKASITLDTTVGKRYFIGGTQDPFFSVENYKVSGDFTVVVSSADIGIFNNYLTSGEFNQPPGVLNLTGPTGNPGMILRIYGIGEIPIGLKSMQTKVTNVVKAGDVMRITCNFTSYTQ